MPTGTQDGRKRLYLDFDGYFAAVEEQAAPALHGRPVAVLPYPEARTCVISANAAAKRHGVGTGTGVDEARRRCPGIALVSQRPDLYVRVQRRIAHAVNAEIPIDAVCSVDELCCVLGARDGAEDVGRRIKARLREAVGPRVTCSMGVASSRWLAKVASAMDKPDGLTVLDALPGRLLELDLEDLPGVGGRVRSRLRRAGIETVSALWSARPRALRAVWGSVHGARLWYALHGHDVGPLRTRRGTVGHGRVLPPEARSAASARPWVRLLVVKAARRLRREGWTAGRLGLAVERLGAPPWQGTEAQDRVNDDRTCLAALGRLWAALAADGAGGGLYRVQVWFDRLAAVDGRQGKLFARGGPGEGAGVERGGRRLERALRPDGGRARALRGCVQRGGRVRGGEDCLRAHSGSRGLPLMLTLRDYAEGSWRFIAVCEGCGREGRVEPGEVLARSGRAHGGMALEDVAGLLRCRGCGRRAPQLEPVVPVRKQAFVGGLV